MEEPGIPPPPPRVLPNEKFSEPVLSPSFRALEGHHFNASDVDANSTLQGIINELTSCVVTVTKNNLGLLNSTASSNTTSPCSASNGTEEEVDYSKWPVPCWALGVNSILIPTLISALVIPLIALLFWASKELKRWYIRKVVRRNYESLEGEDRPERDEELKLEKDLLNQNLEAIKQLSLSGKASKPQRKVLMWIGDAASPQITQGYIAMALAFVSAMLSLTVYLAAVTHTIPALELCGTMPNAQQLVDFIANLYLLIYLLIRIIGNYKTILALTSLHSFVDYFVIPTVFLGIFTNRFYTGFEFLRVYNIMWLVDLIAFRGVFKSHSSLKLCRLIFLIFVILMVSTGFLHLFENTGDFRETKYTGQHVDFWRCFLYLYGKVTLIDLSGMQPVTLLGRITVYVFQLLALSTIARTIPEIVKLIKMRPEYDQQYQVPERFLHIVVAGHITIPSTRIFLREFFHKDRSISNRFKVVVMGEKPPDNEMDALMKSYFNKAEYRRGTVMELKDLSRVKAMESAGIILLTDTTSSEPDHVDSLNIMGVISVKDLGNDIRVIVQTCELTNERILPITADTPSRKWRSAFTCPEKLTELQKKAYYGVPVSCSWTTGTEARELLLYQNKVYVQKIPAWNKRKGDCVVCTGELRLGLLAQSCLAPGFSTLVSNLFSTRSYSPNKVYDETWRTVYAQGASMEIYARMLSRAFVGMNFTQLCQFSYMRFQILLIAIKTVSQSLTSLPQVNPADDECRVDDSSIGYFIADRIEDLNPVMWYCASCHEDIVDPKDIKECDCGHNDRKEQMAEQKKKPKKGERAGLLSNIFGSEQDSASTTTDAILEDGPNPQAVNKIWSYILQNPPSPKTSLKDGKSGKGSKAKRSLSGSAHPSTGDIGSSSKKDQGRYDSTGGFYWCKPRPLVEVTINRQQAAKTDWTNHIVLCLLTRRDSRQIGLHSFVLPLRTSSIPPSELKEIIILGDPKFMEQEWPYIDTFPLITVVKGNPLNRADLRSVSLKLCQMCVVMGSPGVAEHKRNLDKHAALMDKSVIIATLNIRDMAFSENEIIQTPSPRRSESGHPEDGDELTSGEEQDAEEYIVGDLQKVRMDFLPSGHRFLDLNDQNPPLTEFYMSHPFACGRGFSGAVVDTLTILTFFNPAVFEIFSSLVFGGGSWDLEKIVTEGAGLIGGKHLSARVPEKDEVTIKQVPLTGPLLVHAESSYGALVMDCLLTYGRLCLGVYRKMTLYDVHEQTSKRFVIANPLPDFILHHTDLIFCLDRVVLDPELYEIQAEDLQRASEEREAADPDTEGDRERKKELSEHMW